MSNKRKEIRNAFIELLRGKTRALFSVYAEDFRQKWEDDGPTVTVWVGDEDADVSGESPMRYTRKLQVAVRIYMRDVHDPIDRLDDFMSEVETRIDSEDLFTLSESVDRIEYTGSRPEVDSETTRIGASAVLNYSVQYYTYSGVNPGGENPLEGIDATWDDQDFTQDQIDLAQT